MSVGLDYSSLKMKRSFILELGKSYCILAVVEKDSALHLEVELRGNGDILHFESIPVSENPELKSMWNRRSFRFKATEVKNFTDGLLECLS